MARFGASGRSSADRIAIFTPQRKYTVNQPVAPPTVCEYLLCPPEMAVPDRPKDSSGASKGHIRADRSIAPDGQEDRSARCGAMLCVALEIHLPSTEGLYGPLVDFFSALRMTRPALEEVTEKC
ncbi:MAG: hypothetical protein MR450_09660 [Prevotella sp.]|nr:hypothetical protein [Prevotella sp.]MDY4039105.1 hypothetical protein [Prevotella sp.]